MGEALIGGLLAADGWAPADLVVAEVMSARRKELSERFFGWIAYTLSRSDRIDRPGEARRLASAYGKYFFRGGAPRVLKGVQGQYEMASGSVE